MKIRWVNSLVLAVVCVVVSCALGLINNMTDPIITERAQREADEARRELFAEAASFEEMTLAADSGMDSCYAALKGSETIGYVVQITVSGSQGPVQVTTGVDSDSKIVGITVGGTNFAETSGLGARAKEPEFTNQFKDISLPVALGDPIDAITGATITSSAVVSAVNNCGYFVDELINPSAGSNLPEDEVFGGILPGATVSQEEEAPSGVDALWSSDVGAVVYVTQQGRNGDVQVQIGVANNGQVAGLRVNEETLKETPGLGDVIKDSFFLNQFVAQTGPFTMGGNVDAVSGATISSGAVMNAVNIAVDAAQPFLDPEGESYVAAIEASEGESVRLVTVANKVKTHSGVTVIRADEWAQMYPEIYASYLANSENSATTDYVADYPMIAALYEGMAFNTYYSSARGHVYTVADVTETGRPHALANCFSCKTPDFTNMVNEMGDAAYQMSFAEAAASITEPISCYTCHANNPEEITITHTYLIKAMGNDFASVDAANLSCGQCHVEYYFNPATKATSLPYTSLATMNPDDILEYYNNAAVEGQPFADYTNPRTGVRQIKVQHPEFETFMGEGSQHADRFTCADCHMPTAVTADGVSYPSHKWQSPLTNQNLIDSTCSECHTDLVKEVKALQADVERRTYAIGYELEALTERLVEAIASGDYTEAELNEIRSAARNAQFYWDFVFVENSEGAHNSKLSHQCLDKAEALFNEAMAMFKR